MNLNDEQSPESTGGGGGPSRTGMRIGIAAIIGVALVVVVVGAATAVFFRDIIFPQPAGQSAQYLPEDTALFFSINLRPGAGQLGNFREVMATYDESSDFQNLLDDWFDQVEDEADIDLKEDVLPWLGSEVAFAIPEFDSSDDPDMIFLAAANDREAAEDFLDKFMDYIEDSEGVEFDRDSIGGFNTYHAENPYGGAGTHVALTDHYVLIATTEDILENVIDMMEEPDDSLADSEKFVKATEMMLDPRVITLYIDAEAIAGDIEDSLYGEDLAMYQSIEDQIPEVFAMSAALIDMGAKMQVSYTNSKDAFTFEGSNSMKSVDYLPEDTIFMFSGMGLPQLWEETKDRASAELGQQFAMNQMLSLVEFQFGIDIERDIIDWMTGEIAFALISADITLDRFEEIDEAVVQSVALFEFSDREDVDDAMDNIVDALEDRGLDLDETSIDGETIMNIDLRSGFGIPDYDPGFVVLSDRVLVGSTSESLEMALDAKEGNRNSLTKSAKFQRVRKEVSSLDSMIYVDAQGAVETALDTSGPSGRMQYREQAEPIVDPIEAVLIGLNIEQDRTDWTLVVTLQK